MSKITFKTWQFLETGKKPFEVELTITGEHSPAERGNRDEYGAPLEPDYPESFEIESVIDEASGIEYYKKDLPELWAILEDEALEYVCEYEGEPF